MAIRPSPVSQLRDCFTHINRQLFHMKLCRKNYSGTRSCRSMGIIVGGVTSSARTTSWLGRTVAVVLVAIFALGGMQMALALDPGLLQTQRVSVVIVGWDPALAHTTEELSHNLPFAGIERVSSIESLPAAIDRAYGTLIIVGHGTEDGMLLGGETVPWESFGLILREGPAHTFLLAACYSQALRSEIPGRSFFGFSGLVDVDEAAFLVATLVYAFRGNFQKAQELLLTVFEIMVQKAFGTSSHPLETLTHTTYQTKVIRDIWHVKYDSSPFVDYTHPDDKIHYNIGINDNWWRWGSNLFAYHIGKDELDLTQLLLPFIVGLALAGIFTGWASTILAGIIALAGLTAELFIILYVTDENGGGWFWVADHWTQWYGEGYSVKFGEFMWVQFNQVFGIPYVLPLWYGDYRLGIDGW